jgi:hypothetical protein
MISSPIGTNEHRAKERAMAILERHIQLKVKSEQRYREWEKTWEDIETRLGGFPPKRHYFLISGSDPMGTMVWEREWTSFAAMEAAYDTMFADEEARHLGDSFGELYEGERVEYYSVE